MKLIRAALISLLISLLVGMAIGTWIRLKLEAPVRYIGSAEPGDVSGPLMPAAPRAESAAARGPFHVGRTDARILEPRQHEEQIRQPIDVTQHALV